MSFTCLDPYVAVSYFTKLDGKKIMKLYSKNRVNYDLNSLKEKYGQDNVFLLPCGKCESCRKNKANDWAIRCTLEAECHPYNYFLTLTYDDFHLPYASKKDLANFLDRLEGFGHQNKYLYFACQELGELTNRLHYHIILFCDFELDLKDPVKLGGFYHYHSNKIEDTWRFGLHDITPFKTNCARYVAKYTSKSGKLYMSRNIGKKYFLDHYEEILKDGFKVYADFGNRKYSSVPQCFLKWFEEVHPGVTDDHKKFKKSLSRLAASYNKRALVVIHDEDGLKAKQSREIEKGKAKKRI